MAGFPYYNEIPVETPPTLGELVDALTGQEKGAILDGFTVGTAEVTVARRILVPESTVLALYEAIKQMTKRSTELMRGEVELVPAVVDPETGEIITPPVYNTPPASAAELLAEMQDTYSEWFSEGEVTAILIRMVEYSKHDGTGDWAFYSTEVIK
jgi:hypothetical protein